MEFTPREARLKQEFADLYPPLVAGLWETAAEMGAKVLLWQVQQQGTDALNSRILDRRTLRVPGRVVPGDGDGPADAGERSGVQRADIRGSGGRRVTLSGAKGA